MPYIEKIATEKAHRINSTPSIYGTFAEIGAGQEVVNHFFKAGRASQTVAKSMSAYDMTFSDQIYGKAGQYVSENRLFKMLDHEYSLLQKRLEKERGLSTRFFAFADTVVATSSTGRNSHDSYHHGWMGIRFQSQTKTPYNEMILHVKLLDRTRLQQYEVLGILGVNLIYSAFYSRKDHKSIIKSLFDNFEATRVNIDVLRCSGKVFKNLDHQRLNLELIHQNLTQALLFRPNKNNILSANILYGNNVLIQQYEENEIPRKMRSKRSKLALSYIKKQIKIKKEPILLTNLPTKILKNKNVKHFLTKHFHSAKMKKNEYILISNFHKLYELKEFVRQLTQQHIFIFVSSQKLVKLFDKKFYKKSPEDVLEFFSRLCDRKTILMTLENDKLKKSKLFFSLKKHLIENKKLIQL